MLSLFKLKILITLHNPPWETFRKKCLEQETPKLNFCIMPWNINYDICLAVSSTLSNKQSRLSDYQVHINDPDETEYSILVTRASEYKKLDEASSTIIH